MDNSEQILRSLIIDSLQARSGKTLAPDVVHDIAAELIQRMKDFIKDLCEEVQDVD